MRICTWQLEKKRVCNDLMRWRTDHQALIPSLWRRGDDVGRKLRSRFSCWLWKTDEKSKVMGFFTCFWFSSARKLDSKTRNQKLDNERMSHMYEWWIVWCFNVFLNLYASKSSSSFKSVFVHNWKGTDDNSLGITQFMLGAMSLCHLDLQSLFFFSPIYAYAEIIELWVCFCFCFCCGLWHLRTEIDWRTF